MVREQTTHLAQPDSRGGRHHTRAQGKFRAHLIVNWRWDIACVCVRVCVCVCVSGYEFERECSGRCGTKENAHGSSENGH